MRDIALYKTIHYSKIDRLCLQQYVFGQEESDLYLLDLYGFDVFEYRKFMDGDLLTLQLSEGFLDRLCEAWFAHRRNRDVLSDEAKAGKAE
jgi:hypothetical protein